MVLTYFILFCIFIGEIAGIDPPVKGSTLYPSHLLNNVSLNNVIMGKKIECKTGDVINGFIYICDIPKNNPKRRRSRFTCPICNKPFDVDFAPIRHNYQKSCGCLIHRVRNLYYKTRLYNLWDHIKQRCSNPNDNNYHNYGGRGICMYEPWVNDSIAFIEYCMMLNSYNDSSLSFDRKNVNGNYEPGNVRFTNSVVQARNKRVFNHKTGFAGVSPMRGKYHAQLSVNNKTVHLGSYETSELAAITRDQYIVDNNLKGFNLQIL